MTGFWTGREGQVVDSYRLDKWLGGTADSAVYSTEYGDGSQAAVIKLQQVEAADRERQLATWTAISKLAHPHLIRLLDSGQCEVGGVALVYVVMERADANLADVLPDRPLTVVESRDLLESAVAALSYLHEKGFAHGSVKPSNIMAVGEQIKLSSDSITTIDETEPQDRDAKPSREADVRSLGVTLVEAMTQRPPDLKAGTGTDVSIPEPFASVARHSLVQDPGARWRVSQIASRLHGLDIAKPPAPPPLQPPDKPNSRMPLYWIAGVFFVVTAIVLIFGRQQHPAPVTTEPPSFSNPSTPVPQAPLAAAPVAPPKAKDSSVPPASRPVRERAIQSSGSWVVVVATYAQQPDAEKRARSMTREWPDFKPEVYAPPLENKKPYYLVVIGSNLTEQAATELRDRARSAGLARDAYSTRFTR